MPIAHLLELWKGIEVEPMETEPVVEDSALDEEPVKENICPQLYNFALIEVATVIDPDSLCESHVCDLCFKTEKEKCLCSGGCHPVAKKLQVSGVNKAAVCAVVTGEEGVIPSSGQLCKMELQSQLSGGNKHSEKMLESWSDTM